MAVNTEITFQSYEITKSQNYIQYKEPITTDEGETTQDEDSDDENYRPTSDSFAFYCHCWLFQLLMNIKNHEAK